MTEKRHWNIEPTLRDVIEIMDDQFTSTNLRIDSVNLRIDNVDERLGGVDHRLRKVETVVLDIQEELTGALTAVDTDSITLINHEERITRLEEA